MKTLKVIKYNISSLTRSLIIFYSILAIMAILLTILLLFVEDGDSGINTNYSDTSTFIYAMIIGVVFFAEYFKAYLQNGISRKTMFKGYLGSFGVFALILAAAQVVFSLLGLKLSFLKSLADLIYYQRFDSIPLAMKTLEIFLIYLSMFLFVIFFGLFLGILFTKLTKIMKAIIPVSFALSIIALVTLDGNFWKWAVANWFGRVLQFMGGFTYSTEGNPYFLIGSGICLAGLFSLFSWLMMRRATLKE